jgi:hypothetical protein
LRFEFYGLGGACEEEDVRAKPKFRAGQVLRNKTDWRFRKVARIERKKWGYLYYFEDGWQAERESSYRSLTARECSMP